MRWLVLLVLLLPTASFAGQHIIGLAIVTDGDTIKINGTRIRLHGIDAPESRQVCVIDGNPWLCGAEATRKLDEKIGGREVDCEAQDIDRYGRTVAVCSVGGQDLNSWMVRQGLAVAYRKYSMDYVGQEEESKSARSGIWASEFEMPWDWRKSKRRKL